MNKSLQIILSLLLIITVLFNTKVYAEIKEDPKAFVKKTATSLKRSVSSICNFQKVKNLSVVKGRVILKAKNKKLLSIDQSISSVVSSSNSILTNLGILLKGGDSKLRSKKAIRVKGIDDGEIVTVAGVGKRGKGYIFRLPSPTITTPNSKKKSCKKKRILGFPSILSIGFNKNLIEIKNHNSSSISSYVGKAFKKKALVKTGVSFFDKGQKVAEGRFTLKFSKGKK